MAGFPVLNCRDKHDVQEVPETGESLLPKPYPCLPMVTRGAGASFSHCLPAIGTKACQLSSRNSWRSRPKGVPHLPSPLALIGVKVHRGSGHRGVPQIVSHRRQLGTARQGMSGVSVAHPVGLARRSFSAVWGDSASIASATVRKNRFVTLHRRVEVTSILRAGWRILRWSRQFP